MCVSVGVCTVESLKERSVLGRLQATSLRESARKGSSKKKTGSDPKVRFNTQAEKDRQGLPGPELNRAIDLWADDGMTGWKGGMLINKTR
jgi:hypothetical protein